MRIPDDIKALIVELITGYPAHTFRIGKEVEEHRELARKEAREKLLRDFEEYKKEFKPLRGDVEVIKIRNRQKKYEFELHIRTEDGTFPIEKIFGSLTKYVASNQKLRWDSEDRMPDEQEAEPDYIMKFQNVRTVLLEDRRKIDDLLREIRPFVDQPL